ncbi:MAG: hypothetical protein ABSD20_05340 [Terriglobales bacterium]
MPSDQSKIVAMPPAGAAANAAAARQRRPVWIWAICAYVAIGVVTFSLSVLWMLQAGAVTFAAAVVVALGVPCTLLNVAAAVALIRRRKTAVRLFATSLVLTGFATGWAIAQAQAAGKAPGPAATPLYGFAILLLIYLYCSRMKRRGVLR